MTILIIGGGLSGLALADMLQTYGADYLLVDARARFGGRIKTETYHGSTFDLGPAWFWPAQPRIATLMGSLGLEQFDQHAQGTLTFEDETGTAQHVRGHSSMDGSWRPVGGFTALTDAIAARIPDANKRLNTKVMALTKSGDTLTATLENGDTITARHVVLALPPRIAATIAFSPQMSDIALQTMQAIPTWMAGQAKAVATYETAFWRAAGQSGDAMSRHGPMVEIHDATAQNGTPALFGFIGVPPKARMDDSALKQAILSQLTRLFGPKAANPTKLWIKDWARDPFTATQLDAQPLYAHPAYGLPRELAGLWDNTLTFAGTEVAQHFGGFLEGALEAAENAFKSLTKGAH